MTLTISSQLLTSNLLQPTEEDKQNMLAAPSVFDNMLEGSEEETKQEKIDRLNAPIKQKRDAEEAKLEQTLARILEVGFEQYVREQQEVEKLKKILAKIEEEADEQLKEQLGHINDYFETNPPNTVDEMFSYMGSFIAGVADKKLQERMQALLLKIHEMMEEDNLKSADHDRDGQPDSQEVLFG
jgi:hypothetical protein